MYLRGPLQLLIIASRTIPASARPSILTPKIEDRHGVKYFGTCIYFKFITCTYMLVFSPKQCT